LRVLKSADTAQVEVFFCAALLFSQTKIFPFREQAPLFSPPNTMPSQTQPAIALMVEPHWKYNKKAPLLLPIRTNSEKRGHDVGHWEITISAHKQEEAKDY
jgi:hypothetical protein